jgi:hypothetical protein
LGFNAIPFLSEPAYVLPTLAAIGIWQLVGFNMVLFLAGLSAIPRDLYEAAEIDGCRSGIDRFLLARDVQSLVANAPSFLAWSMAPDAPSGGSAMGVATSTRSVSLPRLADELRKGPVALGLVKARDLKGIGRNHQVVAYALKLYGSRVRIAIYDPNHPRSDDTYLYLDLKATDVVVESTGGVSVDAWRGFFVERYSPVVPPGA